MTRWKKERWKDFESRSLFGAPDFEKWKRNIIITSDVGRGREDFVMFERGGGTSLIFWSSHFLFERDAFQERRGRQKREAQDVWQTSIFKFQTLKDPLWW